MNMRIPKSIPCGQPGGPVLLDVLMLASSVWATEPRSRSGVNRATALMLSVSSSPTVERGASPACTPCCSAQSLTAATGSVHLQRRSKRVGNVPAIVVAR